MKAEKRSQFIESITDLLFKNIDLDREADISHCMKLLSDLNLCDQNEFEEFQAKMGGKLLEIAENISQRTKVSQTERQLPSIKIVISYICQENELPSKEMIKSALSIFELEFPYKPPPQKQHRKKITNLAALILSRCNPKKLEMFLKEWMLWRQVSTSIKIYGSQFYAPSASQSLKRWCAEEFKKIAYEITDESDAINWAFKAKGQAARKLLASVGVSKESLNTIFQDNDLAQAALNAWERPIERPVRGGYENELPSAPTPEKI